MKLKRNNIRTIAALAAFAILLVVVDLFLDSYTKRIFNLCAVYVVLALSLNLINGFTGMFSLGHAGFMAVGAYVSALVTMTAAQKDMNFFLTPIAPWLHGITLPFLPALLVAGLVAALFGFLIGAPVLRLRDDYLAIATLGFAEIIRVLITNFQPVTNGAQGLKGLPKYATTWWVWGCAAAATVFMILLMRSSYGRAIKSVRDDEIAAEAMGVNVFRVKVVSFTVSSFMAGVGGALMGHMITTIDPKMFTFVLTYNIVLIVVLGGSGSISGSVIGAVLVTIFMEVLRFLDEPMDLGFFTIPGIPGVRMVVFSILLMAVVIFRQRGLMGTKELSWRMIDDTVRGWGLLLKKARGPAKGAPPSADKTGGER
jgi:branched-chain amino acid transport system permease protein